MAPLQKQLFLSRRVVTESEVFDGGVLVNEGGTIEKVLRRDEADKLLADNGDKIKVVDGSSLALLTGVVDSHVHMNEPGRTEWEGFRTATASAAQGGITTIIDMPLNSTPPTTTVPNLQLKVSAGTGNVYTDVGFWGGVIPGNQDSLRDLVAAGVVGFKCFLCPSASEDFPNVKAADLEKAFKELDGTGTVVAFHAEIEPEKDENEARNQQSPAGDPEEYQTYLVSRSPEMELNAIALITSFLDKTDVRFHVVHVSSKEVIPKLQEAREFRRKLGHEGYMAGVTSETCHHYLSLSAEDIPRGHSEYKCTPPIRDLSNKEALWKYIENHSIDMVVSDHSPCTPDMKCANNLEAWGGISSVQFGLTLFWTEASARGFELFHVSQFLSSGPANMCGLRGRKGAIEAGLDADLVFFDPEATFLLSTDMIKYKHKLSPYLGKKLKGVVKQTYLRGQLIYSDGELVGGPKGQLLLNKTG